MWLREHSSNLEHLASTLAIGGCDNRSMNVKETSLLEELMSCIGQVVSDSCHSSNKVCAGSQVSDLAQEFIGMTLLATQWVFACVTMTKDLGKVATIWLANCEFKELSLGGALDEGSLDLQTGAYVSLCNFIVTFDIFCDNNLKTLDT